MYVLLNWQCPKAVFDTKEKLYSYAKAYSKEYDNEITGKCSWSMEKIDVNPDESKIGFKYYNTNGKTIAEHIEEYSTHYFSV